MSVTGENVSTTEKDVFVTWGIAYLGHIAVSATGEDVSVTEEDVSTTGEDVFATGEDVSVTREDAYLGHIAVTAAFLGDADLFRDAVAQTSAAWGSESYSALGALVNLEHPPVEPLEQVNPEAPLPPRTAERHADHV